jgi:L-lactate dehydrogenase
LSLFSFDQTQLKKKKKKSPRESHPKAQIFIQILFFLSLNFPFSSNPLSKYSPYRKHAMVHHPGRVSIIGAGTLGGTIAYSLMLSNVASEILLVDMSNNILQGQVLDIAEAGIHTNTVIRSGTLKEAGQSSLVIFTADTPRHPKEDRRLWLMRSRQLLLSIASAMSPVQNDITILITSDPVDLYVQSLQNFFSHIPATRIFGLGTTSATDRFKHWLKQMNNQKPVSDAYCIGNQAMPVVVWNYAKVDDVPIPMIPFLVSQRNALDQVVSTHRQDLIRERKGNACFGPAAVATRLAKELLLNQQGLTKTSTSTTNTVNSSISIRRTPGLMLEDSPSQKVWVLSVYVPHYGCCLSWPITLGEKGINTLIDLPLASDEQAKVIQVVDANSKDYQESIMFSQH